MLEASYKSESQVKSIDSNPKLCIKCQKLKIRLSLWKKNKEIINIY